MRDKPAQPRKISRFAVALGCALGLVLLLPQSGGARAEEPGQAALRFYRERMMEANDRRALAERWYTTHFKAVLAEIDRRVASTPGLAVDYHGTIVPWEELPDGWQQKATTTVIGGSIPTEAQVVVLFGRDDLGNRYDRLVSLRQVDGAWRIDDITDTPAELANGRPSPIDFSTWTYDETLSKLLFWASRRYAGRMWSLQEMEHCRLRETFASHYTGGGSFFTEDTLFAVADLDLREERRSLRQFLGSLVCKNEQACATFYYSSGNAGTVSNLEIGYQDDRGPEVFGALQRLGELCR
jgi:hypothetical protein